MSQLTIPDSVTDDPGDYCRGGTITFELRGPGDPRFCRRATIQISTVGPQGGIRGYCSFDATRIHEVIDWLREQHGDLPTTPQTTAIDDGTLTDIAGVALRAIEDGNGPVQLRASAVWALVHEVMLSREQRRAITRHEQLEAWVAAVGAALRQHAWLDTHDSSEGAVVSLRVCSDEMADDLWGAACRLWREMGPQE